MAQTRIEKDYFEWMYELACGDRYTGQNSYKELLNYLHETTFTFSIRKDVNRAYDGIDLRYRFAEDHYPNLRYDEVSELLSGPCSVLEMMIALAIRCEESIMDDPSYGDRKGQWFWKMIVSLGLGAMTDRRFDINYVKDVVNRFLAREYEPDGRGGLFRIRDCEHDLREVEIWIIMLWYLDSITHLKE